LLNIVREHGLQRNRWGHGDELPVSWQPSSELCRGGRRPACAVAGPDLQLGARWSSAG